MKILTNTILMATILLANACVQRKDSSVTPAKTSPAKTSKQTAGAPRSQNQTPGSGQETTAGKSPQFPQSWYACNSVSSGRIKGHSTLLHMDGKGAVSIESNSHPDSGCKKVLSEKDLDAIAAEFNPDYETMSSDQKEALRNAMSSSLVEKVSGKYKLQKQPSEDGDWLGEFDLKSGDGKTLSYTSFAIGLNDIRYIPTCSAEDVSDGSCPKILGESASNRASDFKDEGLIILQKK